MKTNPNSGSIPFNPFSTFLGCRKYWMIVLVSIFISFVDSSMDSSERAKFIAESKAMRKLDKVDDFLDTSPHDPCKRTPTSPECNSHPETGGPGLLNPIQCQPDELSSRGNCYSKSHRKSPSRRTEHNEDES